MILSLSLWEDDTRDKHDPSLFRDDDGTWYLTWSNTEIAPLKPDFQGLAAKPVHIDPSDRSIGTKVQLYGR